MALFRILLASEFRSYVSKAWQDASHLESPSGRLTTTHSIGLSPRLYTSRSAAAWLFLTSLGRGGLMSTANFVLTFWSLLSRPNKDRDHGRTQAFKG